ncbi:MAG TPA: radical SAM protein [Armatimonadota bacterium]|nr:radical SAM protein [Armatimonadota bacterium]
MSYPAEGAARSRWIVERRPGRNSLDPRRPYAVLVEPEVGADGAEWPVATVFLTNRECAYRCLMCDLWRNTLEETVPEGAIAEQVEYALQQLPPARVLKLYNAGSFFDPRAIPPAEHPAIARLAAPFERVVVECHPALVGPSCPAFQDRLRETAEPGRAPALEVAMGLETVHPEVLPRLNKRMTLEQFRRAASFLADNGIALRVFILVRPPWLTEAEGVEWACRSLDFAFECGASVCALIPTRAGNGAMEALAAAGEFEPPSLPSVEAALEYGLELRAGRVMADLWDIRQFATCPRCADARMARLEAMNGAQTVPPPVECGCCNG